MSQTVSSSSDSGHCSDNGINYTAEIDVKLEKYEMEARTAKYILLVDDR